MAISTRKNKASDTAGAPKRGVKRARSDTDSEALSDITLDYVDLEAEESASTSSVVQAAKPSDPPDAQSDSTSVALPPVSAADAEVSTTDVDSGDVTSGAVILSVAASAGSVAPANTDSVSSAASLHHPPASDSTHAIPPGTVNAAANPVDVSSSGIATGLAAPAHAVSLPVATSSAVATSASTTTPAVADPNVVTAPAAAPALNHAVAQTPVSAGPGGIIDITHINFTPAEVDYIPDELVPRLVSILNFADPGANRYAIGLLPASASWGPSGDGSGLDKYLCCDNRPLIAWMVGVPTTVWLTPLEGSRVNIGLRLLTERDQQVARRIQYTTCRPPGDPAKAGPATYASKFLATRGDNVTSSFEDVFDASTLLESWSSMDRISPDRVRKTDVVLVECYVRRFKTRDNSSRYVWKTWGVNFELLRIAHLLRGPGPTELIPEESSVSL